MNLKYKRRFYIVDLENKTVKNKNGGYLRSPEKIQEILGVAKKCKESREKAKELFG